MNRRELLQAMLVTGAGSLLPGKASARPGASHEFFVFIHAGGGWDVTLWADPRNERRGLVEPATIANTDIGGLVHWKTVGDSFEPIVRDGMALGPAIGALLDVRDRLTVVNGLAMNTVSHEDGVNFVTTGRHRRGGVVPESSVDAVVASALGADQLMPDVSIRFPSMFVGTQLDRRAIPLRVSSVEAITSSFGRSPAFLSASDRRAVSLVLAEEARSLAKSTNQSGPYDRLAGQHAQLPALLEGDFIQALQPPALQQRYARFAYGGRLGMQPLAGAFALEAMRRNIARCVSFGIGGFDTHRIDHRQHALLLQELFGVVATMLAYCDTIPHPTRPQDKLSEHTHFLIVSEFCRTPQLNVAGGRDHYPNNSALVISPRFRKGVFGATDREQLLPAPTFKLGAEKRALAPPDVLATFLAAFGIEPRKYMRDGEVVTALLV